MSDTPPVVGDARLREQIKALPIERPAKPLQGYERGWHAAKAAVLALLDAPAPAPAYVVPQQAVLDAPHKPLYLKGVDADYRTVVLFCGWCGHKWPAHAGDCRQPPIPAPAPAPPAQASPTREQGWQRITEDSPRDEHGARPHVLLANHREVWTGSADSILWPSATHWMPKPTPPTSSPSPAGEPT